MPPLVSANWPRFVYPVIRREWDQRMTSINSPLMSLINVQGSTQSQEFSQGVGNFGLVPEYNSSGAEKPGNGIQYDTFNPLFESTFTHKEYALGVTIERKLVDDNRTNIIIRKAQSLGLSFGTTRAVHCSGILNNAFDSSVKGGDGVALCSASHKTNENDATTISNAGSTALDYGSVVDTILAGASLKDDRGQPMPSIFDVLYVPVSLQAKAFEISQAVGKPGGNNNDANFLQGITLRTVVDPYLTDANNWFMIDSSKASIHALWFNRVMPELTMDPASDYNLEARYRGYMRYSYGWDDFRWIYGHAVS